MSLYSLLQRRCFPIAARMQLLRRSFHNLNAFSTPEPDSSISAPSHPENTQFSPSFHSNTNQFTPNPLSSSSFNFTPLSRSQGFLSAEEAAAERRRRKRRLRIEPPIQIGQRPPPPPRNPRQPDSTSSLTGPRLNLHNRVQSLIRAFDLEAASKLARSAVHGRIRPTVFTCNAIIAAMHRAKRYEESKSLFCYFFEQNTIVPNVVSYNYLINSLCDEGNVDEALTVYRRIIAEAPFGPSHVTYRHLTKGLVDAKRIEEAVELLREMLNKGHGADSLVYNNLINGYLYLGNTPRADEFFNELKERCLVYDGVVNATYMEFWFEQGKDKEAMDSYKSLLDKKYRMVPATCNVLLSILLKYGKKEQAWALFEHMLDDHTPPTFQAVNTETFNIMVNECFKEGNVEKAVETFRMSGKKVRSKPFAMEVATYNNMIARFCEIDKPKEAETYFDELCSKSLNPDVLSFRTLIDAYLNVEQVDDAVKYLTKMVVSGLRVVASYGVEVFGKLLTRGKYEEVFRILSAMGEKEPKPDCPVYEVVVKGFCDAGELGKIEEILKQVMAYGVVLSSPLKEMIRNVFEREGRGRDLEDILDEKKWRNHLSYSHTGRQSSVSFQWNRSQTASINQVSNFPNRKDSSGSSLSGQHVPSSNQQHPWTAQSLPSGENFAPLSQSNGQSSPQKELGEIVKQIGSHNQPLNPPNFEGVKNGDHWPREDNVSTFYGTKSSESHRQSLNQQVSWKNGITQHQPPTFQSLWNNQREQGSQNFSGEESQENYNGMYHQPLNPQTSWNSQGGLSSTNFPVEENPWDYRRVDQQPSNPQGSWNLQDQKDTVKSPVETNSWKYNVGSEKPLNQQNSWNYEGGNNSGYWPGNENSSNYQTFNSSQGTSNSYEPQPMGAHTQPSYQQKSQFFQREGPSQWPETTKPCGSYHQPFNPYQNSLNFHESKPIGAHHQPSYQHNSGSFQGKTPHQWPEKENSPYYSQNSKPFEPHLQPSNPTQNSSKERNPNRAHHQPYNQQNPQSESLYQWTGKENSPNFSQTSSQQTSWPNFSGQEDPLKASKQWATHQNSWSFSDTRSPRRWPEDKQSSNDSGIPNRPLNQESSWSSDALYNEPSNFWKEKTKLETNKAKEKQNMSTNDRWRPPPPTSTQYPFAKTDRNVENMFRLEEKPQSTMEAGDWFAEGVSKTIAGIR